MVHSGSTRGGTLPQRGRCIPTCGFAAARHDLRFTPNLNWARDDGVTRSDDDSRISRGLVDDLSRDVVFKLKQRIGDITHLFFELSRVGNDLHKLLIRVVGVRWRTWGRGDWRMQWRTSERVATRESCGEGGQSRHGNRCSLGSHEVGHIGQPLPEACRPVIPARVHDLHFIQDEGVIAEA